MNRTSNFADVVLSALIALTMILSAVQVIDVYAASTLGLNETAAFSPGFADIDRFVATTGNDDSGNNSCTDYTNPCATIDQAINNAQSDDIIAVAEGVYVFTGQLTPGIPQFVVSINGVLIGRLSLYGGWNSDFSSQVGFSTIDGEKKVAGVRVYGGSQQQSPQILFDHFKITNGAYGGVTTSFPNLIINNSAIYNNVKTDAYANGGGIANSGSITLNNVTVSNNTIYPEIGGAGGGIYSYGGSAILNNVTITDNHSSYDGGGVSLGTAGAPGAVITITNSILYGNSASHLGPDCNGTLAGTANNIVGNTSGCSIFSAGNGNQLNVNPLLGAFIDGVGYQPLLAGSPAINAGLNCYGTSDQRGYTRVDTCDIGAYEFPDATGSAIRLVAAEGDDQRTAPMHEFSLPLRVAALDANGSPVSGQSVQFIAPVSGASGFFPGQLTSITIATGADGTAGTLFTANEERGDYQVAAELAGALPTSFTLQNAAWYVANSGDDTADCASPVTACATIDAAVAKADMKDVILVAAGIYTGDSNYTAAVNIDKGVIVVGGWNAAFDAQTGYSIVDGEDERPGISIYASNVNLDHFVVENGYSAMNGGGILIGGRDITITNLVVRNSRAGNSGGGIAINGANGVTITHAAIYNNHAEWGGGGIATYGDVELILANSTVAHNSTLGGGGGISGTAELNNVTVVENSSMNAGGGINGTITLQNSILARNSSGSSPNCAGSITSNGHNIIENTSGCSFVSNTGDLTGIDSRAGTFLPSRGYAPLLSDSPAINSGAGCNGTTDQRGVARVGQCDIGAYEYDPVGAPAFIEPVSGNGQRIPPNNEFLLPFSVVVLDDNGSPVGGVSIAFSAPASGASGVFANQSNVDAPVLTDNGGIGTATVFTANDEYGNYLVAADSAVGSAHFDASNFNLFVDLGGSDTNDCQSVVTACATIDGAISKALENDTIYVSTGVFTSSSGNQVVNVTKNLAILGGWDSTFSSPDGTTVIDAQGVRGGVNIPVGVTARMQYFTIQNAGGYYKYAISNAGNFTVDECLLINNGSGIYNKGTLVATDCRIQGNASEGVLNDGHLTLTDVVVNNNQGKGVYNRDYYGVGIVTVNSSIISNNLGPGIYNQATLFISRSSISENSAPNGAGIYAVGGSVALENSTIVGNAARGPGGGIYVAGGTFLINNATISGNSASSGGGIYQEGGGSVSLKNSILGGNIITTGEGPDCKGVISSLGANIISSSSGCTFGSGSGDQINVNPLLGTYLPTEGYQPLMPGSPAINSGNPTTCLATDQRGVARVGTCDKGAYEYVAPGAAVKMVIVGGDDQHIPLNESPVWPLKVAALDAIGSPVSGVSITFTAPPSGPSGTFADTHTFTTTVQTGVDGVATSPEYVTNDQLGAYAVTVSSSLGNIAFNLKNLVWFVSPDGSNSNTCLAPALPCANIIGALGKAGFYPGDTIWIKKGTYDLPGVTYMEILKSASLVGGWNNDFTAQDDTAVLKDSVLIPFYSLASRVVRISQVTFDGAGIYSNGNVLFLERSSIINSPADGVGIAGGQATITNSTISNTAGNAVEVRNNGSVPSPVSIIASTIIGNVHNDAAVGTVYVASSIIAICGGDFSSNGYNIIGNAGNPNLFICGGWLATDIVGGSTPLDLTKFINTTLTKDPRSGQWHYPLVYHSVASENNTIDKVPVGDGCPGTDQLGVPRPQNTKCDIGAVEFIFAPSIPALTSPASNALVTDYTPLFNWSDATSAYHYRLQVDDNSDFSSPVLDDATITVSEFTPLLDLPSNKKLYWRVQALNFVGDANAWTASRYFRTALLPPTTISPGNLVPGAADNVHTRRPTFVWDAVPGATGYTLEVSTTPSFSSKAINASPKTTTYTHTADLVAGTVYYWRVKATGSNGPSLYSATRTFTTGNPPSVPGLTAPAGNALLSDLTPVFDWSDATGGVHHYELQTATDTAFTQNLTHYTGADNITGSTFTPTTDLLPGLKFYWRVRSVNAAEDMSAWSASRYFRTAYLPPNLVSPESGVNVHTRRPNFAWDAVPGATGYTLEVSTTIAFSSKAISASPKTNTYTHTSDLAANTVYYWRVKATGPNGPSLYSATRAFTTGNPPSVPGLTAPASNALLSDLTPVFDWSDATGGVHHYELQIARDALFTVDVTNVNDIPVSTHTPVIDLSTGVKYYWRVRSYNAAGDYSAWSASRYFRTAFAAPGLLTPAFGSTTGSLKPTFTWAAVIGATQYRIQISISPLFSSMLVNTTKTGTSFVPISNLPANTLLYWRVQASAGSYAPGFWSTVFEFHTP